MALAKFFDKINLSAAQRLLNHDRTGFENKLLEQCIGIALGDNAATSVEGKHAVDLLVRILARLYPNISFQPHGEAAEQLVACLQGLALSINPKISCTEPAVPVSAWIVIGTVEGMHVEEPVFYIGSQNWAAHYSVSTQQTCGDTTNPFGAGAATCLVAANLFRHFFAQELGGGQTDTEVRFSVFSQSINSDFSAEPLLPETVSINLTLFGTGAIGNGVLWSLVNLPQLEGKLSLVDKQEVALSNLQRYVLLEDKHKDKVKVEVLKEVFNCFPSLHVMAYPSTWQSVVSALEQSDQELIATALDSKEERFQVQSALPRSIYNAWTDPGGIGVSRHSRFDSGPCLACLYLPVYEGLKDTQKIADALGMPDEESFINDYLSEFLPVDQHFIDTVHEKTGIAKETLEPFLGCRLEVFYGEGICGGKVVEIPNGKVPQDMEVALAQESALAGILLAAEVVIASHGLRSEAIEPTTRIDLSVPLHPFLKEELNKHFSGNCICQDEVFSNRYREKWPVVA